MDLIMVGYTVDFVSKQYLFFQSVIVMNNNASGFKSLYLSAFAILNLLQPEMTV